MEVAVGMKIQYSIKNIFIFIVGTIFLILFSSFISALTVAVPGDLSLYPGQVYDTGFDIMNTIGGSGDLVLEAQFSEGSEIVSFTQGNRFEVPGGSSVPAFVRFRIPANAALGTIYPIKVVFKTVSEGKGSGSVSFVEDVVTTFKVTIVEQSTISVQPTAEAEKVSVFSNVWFWIIVIIIIVIILWLIFKVKKKQ